MQRRYFGTDGVRGHVGEHPITADFMLKLGWAAGKVLAPDGGGRVVIGKDTRISGYMFEAALEAGLTAAGIKSMMLGPLPTPGIAYLTRTLRARAGIVISASHNAYQDNGIKFFSAEGYKLPDAVELAIEAQIDKPMDTVASESLGKAVRVEDSRGRYIEFCKGTVPSALDLGGMKIVLDCANGATYHTGPRVFEELGANIVAMGTEPNGVNINAGCGSTHPEALQSRVLSEGADLGIAFDGDGDRLVMVDHKGELVDGDELLYVIANERLSSGREVNGVVGTLMSNLGLEHALRDQGIALHRAKVGDRYVMEVLKEKGLVLGGESSGHIICLDRTTTGDGTISALQVLAAMYNSGNSLNALKTGMSKYPQLMVNVRIKGRVDLSEHAAIQSAVQAAEDKLAGRGRVLLRPSGTEPLVRVMVEGEDGALVETVVNELADVVRSQVGA
ncbi:MAG: phosphoglucosamine mutase [Gammaproteobacteria bacterium]